MIGGIGNMIGNVAGALGNTNTGAADGASFAKFMQGGIDDFISTQKQSEQLTQQAASGKANTLEVITAVNNAEMTLNTIVNVRDKFVQAMQEIMRTAV